MDQFSLLSIDDDHQKRQAFLTGFSTTENKDSPLSNYAEIEVSRKMYTSRRVVVISGEKFSFKTMLIAIELVAIIFMSGWLFTEYNTSITARQAVDQLLHRAYLDQIALQLSIFGRSLNFLILPLRFLTLSLLTLVSSILILLLLFMFTTFLISTITGRGRPGRR